MRQAIRTALVALAVGLAGAGTALAAGQPADSAAPETKAPRSAAEQPKDMPVQAPASQLETVRGVLKDYRRDARGHIDGMILEDGTVIAFQTDVGNAVFDKIRPGDPVEVQGWRLKAPGGQEQIRAATLLNLNTKQAIRAGMPIASTQVGQQLPPGQQAQQPGMAGMEMASVQGKIASLQRDEKNNLMGFTLEDGTQVAVPARALPYLTGMLVEGHTVAVTGTYQTGGGGGTTGMTGRVLMPSSLTDMETNRTVVLSPAMPVPKKPVAVPVPKEQIKR